MAECHCGMCEHCTPTLTQAFPAAKVDVEGDAVDAISRLKEAAIRYYKSGSASSTEAREVLRAAKAWAAEVER